MIRTLACVFILATAVACGGGGSDGTSTVIGNGGLLAASFVSDEPVPAGRSVGLAETGSSANLVTVAVRVTDTDDIFAAGFDVDFDPTRVQYVNWAPGVLLETGGQSVIYNVAPHASRLVVGATRVAPASGVNATGSRAVVYLTFRVIVAGNSAIALTDGSLLDSQPPGPTAIPGISWSGGQVLAH